MCNSKIKASKKGALKSRCAFLSLFLSNLSPSYHHLQIIDVRFAKRLYSFITHQIIIISFLSQNCFLLLYSASQSLLLIIWISQNLSLSEYPSVLILLMPATLIKPFSFILYYFSTE